jgi:hypothetical protein
MQPSSSRKGSSPEVSAQPSSPRPLAQALTCLTGPLLLDLLRSTRFGRAELRSQVSLPRELGKRGATKIGETRSMSYAHRLAPFARGKPCQLISLLARRDTAGAAAFASMDAKRRNSERIRRCLDARLPVPLEDHHGTVYVDAVCRKSRKNRRQSERRRATTGPVLVTPAGPRRSAVLRPVSAPAPAPRPAAPPRSNAVLAESPRA